MEPRSFAKTHVVIYESYGAEVARYSVTAASELQAERRSSARFFKEHPEFDPYEVDLNLTFRVEVGEGRAGAAKGPLI